MQKLTIAGTTYTLKSDRDLAKLLKAAKAKPKMTRQSKDVRKFPLFIPGQTSTMEYVRNYWIGNGFSSETYQETFGGRLSPLPAPVYDPLEPEVLMETLD